MKEEINIIEFMQRVAVIFWRKNLSIFSLDCQYEQHIQVYKQG